MSTRTCPLCESTSAGTAVRFTKNRALCDWCVGELERRALCFCTDCATTFPFAQSVRSAPNRCPVCRKAKRQARYAANREREHANARAWRAAHPGVESARIRERYQTDATYRERRRAYHRAYYWRNHATWRARVNANRWRWRASLIASVKRWKARNPDYMRQYRVRKLLGILRGGA